MIRPQPARWFETLVARDDAFVALEALALTGTVEIQRRRTDHSAAAAAEVNRLLREYDVLSRRYCAYWPTARLRASTRIAPADALAAAIPAIGKWAVEADPLIAQLQDAQTEIAQLDTVARVMDELHGTPIDFSAIGHPGGCLLACIFVYPKRARLTLPSSILLHSHERGEETFLLAVGAPETIEWFAQEVGAANGRRTRVPEWLCSSAEESLALIADRCVARKQSRDAARAALRSLHDRRDLALVLGDVVRAAWCLDNVDAIEDGKVFSRITGWTSDTASLGAAAEGSDARALASFPRRPHDTRPPLLLRNPWWAKPFEVFSRLFGMPGRYGADPTALLAVAVPLLFGYMFGDVGQGLVLAALGLALRERMPVLRLLIPAGISAAVFGVFFGSVFSVEHLIDPIWVNPIEDPLLMLGVPLAAGVLLLTIGLALDALGAHWAGELDEWLATKGGFVAVYLGILAALFHPTGIALTAAGAAAVAFGPMRAHRGFGAVLEALAELLGRTMQILINTLSFVRVGAFALAHAGLSSAVITLAHATGGTAGFIVILVIGNVVIIALEGLVVSVQTTRLILFEFFARFFQAEGRALRPLLPPPIAMKEN